MQKNKKNIVLITTWFPPLEGVAVNRMLAFAHYLDKTKYNIIVITLKKGDEATEEEYFPGAYVYRLPNENLLKLPQFKNDPKWKHYLKVAWKLFVLKIYAKNEYKKWSKETSRKLYEIHKRNKIDMIISSYAPIAPHLVAMNFCRQNKSVKWIADMRDEMSMNLNLKPKTRNYYKKVEKEISKIASALTTVSQPIVEYFKETIPNLGYYREIRNGFDHEMDTLSDKKANSCFTMLYAGNFYGKRKPDTFFKSVNQLYIEGKMPENWRISFVGSPHNFKIPHHLLSNIEFIEKVTQSESIRLMQKADLNLLIQPSFGRKGIYTGKLFDYISVLKPVFAVVDKTDVAAQLISELNVGYVCDFDNVEEIKAQLEIAIDDWKNNKQPIGKKEEIEKLHRKYQVEKLATLIDRLLV